MRAARKEADNCRAVFPRIADAARHLNIRDALATAI
jgi:hypothetical protein